MDINEYIRDNYLYGSDQALADELGISAKAVRERRRRMGLSKADGPANANELPTYTEKSEQDSGVTILDKLLKDNGISLNEVGSVRISSYQQGQKNAEGESETVNLGAASVTLKVDPSFATGPEWPVIQQAAPVKFERKTVRKSRSKFRTAVIFPDQQIGYRRNLHDGSLDPFHDEQAMAVAMNIARDIDPDDIINLGDIMDFAVFGRFDQEPGFQLTTQPTLDRTHSHLAEQVEIARNVVAFQGNHDLRLQKWITKNAMAAFGLTRANAPEEWPVMSVEFLLRLEELGVEYVDGYPNGKYYINDRLRCEHGSKTAPRGKIASKIVADENVSIITGHTHRVEQVYKTTPTRFGPPKVSMGMTLGCLCRTDGAVPSTKSTYDAKGNAVLGQMDWQQAVGIVEYIEGDGPFNVTPVLIQNGEAIYQDSIYTA